MAEIKMEISRDYFVEQLNENDFFKSKTMPDFRLFRIKIDYALDTVILYFSNDKEESHS